MHNPYGSGTNKFYIAEQAIAGKSKQDCLNALRPMVEAQILVYKRNRSDAEKAVGLTHRVALDTIALQIEALSHDIGRVYKALGLSIGNKFEDAPTPENVPDEIPTPDPILTPETPEEEEEIQEEEETPMERPIAKGKRKLLDELLYFEKRALEIRSQCMRRDEKKEGLDWISIRAFEGANRLIPAGIPADALLYTMTLQWEKETREEMGIPEYDMEALSQSIMEERKITEIIRTKPDGTQYSEKPHVMFGYILTLAERRQPILLVGEFGTSKSYQAHQLADYLGLPYAETPMSLGATRGDLLGRFTASKKRFFISAKFPECYGSGGVFNFEEFDAADAGMIIVLNNALAGDVFYNSNSGETVYRHDNFIPIATANTWGDGANRRYNARQKLDSATLDRWRMGRVYISPDAKVERSVLFKGLDFNLETPYL